MAGPAAMAPASGGQDAVFDLGDLPLGSGATLRNARLSYRVLGNLNRARSNLVLMPTSYGAWPEDLSWTVGPILDPERWCVVVVSQFGNGRSSSPSHGHLPLGPQGWPLDHSDNLRAQLRLLEEVFRVEAPALVYGWSMGAQQAYHWAALEPERVGHLCCLCGTARTTPHNRLFLLSLRQALTADPHWHGSGFTHTPTQGLRTFALIYASWAASQSFYRQGRHLQQGFHSVEDYVERAWLPSYARHDPRDLIAMLDVWLANDLARAWRGWGNRGRRAADPVAADREAAPERQAPLRPEATAGTGPPGLPGSDPGRNDSTLADLRAALAEIRARTCVIAGRHDLYFTPEDCAAEAALIPGARFTVLDSALGHRAGNPRDAPREQALIRAEVDALCQG